MKKLLISLSFLTLGIGASAQTFSGGYYDFDALRLTQLDLSGNARYVAMGGAFGALGGNSSALSVNPATIGIYKKSDFSFTPSVNIVQSNAKHWNGSARDDERWRFNIANFALIGAVQTGSTDAKDEWKFAQFGFTVNRIANFSSSSTFSGFTGDGWTYLDYMTEDANLHGNLEDDNYRGMAYDIGLIYLDTNDNLYKNDLVAGGLTQRQTIRTSGGITEMAFTGGANYGDILYLGASIGIPFYNFSQKKTLTETDTENDQPDFNSWSLNEDFNVSGTGVNFKFGAIVRPIDFLRLGFAFHTPTFYTLNENFETKMRADAYYADPSVPSFYTTYKYSLRVPGKIVGSVGFVIGKIALLGFEYERTNYANMRFNDEDGHFDDDNDYIAENYKAAGIFKTGLEVRLAPMSLRAGFNYYESPYQENFYNFSQYSFSAGIGWTFNNVNLDIAYCNKNKKEDYYLYPNYNLAPPTKMKYSDHQILVTLGVRF